VLGMVIGTALSWSNVATVVISIVLAFVFGYSLTVRPVLKSGLPVRAADTVSIAVVEVVDNAVVLGVPGALNAGLDSRLFWAGLVLSPATAFAVTVPVNRWMISRGKGHAVVHQYHGGGQEARH
jgi:hypothetical protein